MQRNSISFQYSNVAAFYASCSLSEGLLREFVSNYFIDLCIRPVNAVHFAYISTS